MSSGEAQFGDQALSAGVPRFRHELDPWYRVFFGNLAYLVVGGGQPVESILAPGEFWPDVFVARGLPWGKLAESFFFHACAIAAVCYLTQAWVLRPAVKVESAARDTKLTYYQVSEYLPAISSGDAPARPVQKGQPAYSPQPIISIPNNPDNSYQTIVNPKAPDLISHAVKLPNLVVATPVPAPPVAGATHRAITLPWLATAPVPPPAENTSRSLADLKLQGRAPSVVEPAPDENVRHKLGDLTVAAAQPEVAAPKLPVEEQRAASGQGQGTQAAPPPPPISVGGAGGKAVGQLLALGLEPVAPSGPIEVPSGSRRGIFAATPEGNPGAPGVPDITASGKGGAGTGGGGGSNPAGIFVGGGPGGNSGAVAGMPSGGGGSGGGGNVTVAAARPAPDIPSTTPGANLPRSPTPGSVEQQVFGPRQYYSMVLNMPNLTSAGGSWIIRFAELKQSREAAELSAPVALHKVDPAYPPSLMKAHVEGTVVLYAIIRADGTVDAIKVLRGLDDTLDQNAEAALKRWQFRPGMRKGVPVDIEAVVQITFAARRSAF
jgi:TonB family protein